MIRLASIVALLSLALTAQTAAARVGVGDLAPPITLEALTNVPNEAPAFDALSWDHFDGQTVVLEFWGTWCGPCVAAIPHLNELAEATAGEDVAFLAVTFEETGIVEKFLDKMEMNSWIGHDTDRSMVEAFGVRAWPTTFIIRDGLVLARTYPRALTEKRLLELATGDASAIVAEARAKREAQEAKEAEEKAARAEVDPIIEIRLAPTPDGFEGGSMSSGGLRNLKAKGSAKAFLARTLWNGYPYQDIEIDEPDARYDLLVDAVAAPEDAVREILARALGLEMTVESREIDGFVATLADGGVSLGDGVMDEPMGYSMRYTGEARLISSSAMSLSRLLSALESTYRTPIHDDTGVSPDRYFFVDLTLPEGAAELAAALEEQTGIVLEPARLEREVAVIRSTPAD